MESPLKHVGRPDVSVVIPTCDRPDYVEAAIKSVLAQVLQPGEILVIDNGETPLCLPAMPPQVKLYRIAPKVGPSRARNFGAAIAGGKYLAFLDDDDWWDPRFLVEARAALLCQKVRCIYGQKKLWVAGRMLPYKLPSLETLNVATLLRRNPGTGGMNLLIERMLFLKIGGFDERLLLSEDRALALEVLLSGEPIGVASNAVAIVRHHAADRLRKRHHRKIHFVWKYRKHYTGFAHVYLLAAILFMSLLRLGTRALPSPERHDDRDFTGRLDDGAIAPPLP